MGRAWCPRRALVGMCCESTYHTPRLLFHRYHLRGMRALRPRQETVISTRRRHSRRHRRHRAACSKRQIIEF